MENEALEQVEETGFWNMECVKISVAEQLRKLNLKKKRKR